MDLNFHGVPISKQFLSWLRNLSKLFNLECWQKVFHPSSAFILNLFEDFSPSLLRYRKKNAVSQVSLVRIAVYVFYPKFVLRILDCGTLNRLTMTTPYYTNKGKEALFIWSKYTIQSSRRQKRRCLVSCHSDSHMIFDRDRRRRLGGWMRRGTKKLLFPPSWQR